MKRLLFFRPLSIYFIDFMYLVCIGMLTLSFSACSRIPQPLPYVYSSQQKMQAAHHWNVLANDVANQINMELIKRDYLEKSVYVEYTCDPASPCEADGDFPFDEGFHDLLTSQLVNFGVPTNVEPEEGTLKVEYKVQVLYHDAYRRQIQPGQITALSVGIEVLRGASSEVVNIAMATAADILLSTTTFNGHYEVIITTSMVDNNQYFLHRSDIYYINDADFWHYRPASPAADLLLISSHY